MTATAAVTADVQVREIPIDDLFVSPDNPRKTFDQAQLEELAATIRQGGIRVPLAVRPQALSFEIVAGQRRYAAGRLAGLATLPCIVREMTDAEAAEWALIDNAQRVDVPALEEAQAFEALLARLGSVAAVAARVGKEVSHVARRLKLRSLGLAPCDALRLKLITVDHALLLARLGLDEQDAACKWTLDHSAGVKKPLSAVIDEIVAIQKRRDEKDWPSWEPQSVLRLKEHIQGDAGPKLDRAPWPLEEDWPLPDVGSCLDCPKNTKANAPLFGDLEIGEPTCTDGGCFKEKTEAFVLRQLQEAAKSAKGIVRVSWKLTNTEPRMTLGEPCDGPSSLNNFTLVPKLDQTFKAGQWVEATKKCEHVRTAVTVDWSESGNRGYMGRDEELRKPGEILQVCIAPKCKAHPKGYEKSLTDGHANAAQQVKDQREIERRKAFVEAEGPVRRALYDAILAKIEPDTIKRNALLSMQTAVECICRADNFSSDDWQKKRAHAVELIDQATGSELDALLFHATFAHSLLVQFYEMTRKDKGRAQLRELAKVAGVDAARIERKFDQVKKTAAKQAKKAAKKKAAKPAKDHTLSPVAKKRIVKAFKTRLEKQKAKTATKAEAAEPKLSEEARKRISDATKRRWAGKGVHVPDAKLQVTLTDDDPDRGDS